MNKIFERFSNLFDRKKVYEEINKSPFYSKYPPTGKMRLQYLDQRGAYDPDFSFFYNRIPKVANSTIIYHLLEKSGKTDRDIHYKNQFLKSSDMKKEDLDEIDKIFKFFFVRDPYSRVLSAYKDKVCRKKYLSMGGKIENVFFYGSNAVPSFSEFVGYLSKGGLYDNAHWAPQADLILMPAEQFDFIGRFENLQEDLNYVFEKIFKSRIDGDLYVKGPPQTNSSSSSLLSQYYTDEDRRIIEKLYEEDFKIIKFANQRRANNFRL